MAGVPLIVTEEPMFKDEIFVYGTCRGRGEQMRGTKPVWSPLLQHLVAKQGKHQRTNSEGPLPPTSSQSGPRVREEMRELSLKASFQEPGFLDSNFVSY